MALTFEQVVYRANQIFQKWNEAADRDAAFDGGEFSGPASARAADKEVFELAMSNGFTLEQVLDEMNKSAADEFGDGSPA